jgi:hypothetical protein
MLAWLRDWNVEKPPIERAAGYLKPHTVTTPKEEPISEAERLAELEGLLKDDFETFREVCIEHHWMHSRVSGRVDLLALPKARDYASAVIAFEVKGDGFHLARALKQSADYVGGRVLNGRCYGKRVAACFLYPAHKHRHGDHANEGEEGMFQLIAQWRVGRGYVRAGGEVALAIGAETIWDSDRGWHDAVAERMLLGKRTVGGIRREFNRNRRIDLKALGLERLRRRKL